MKVSIIIPIYNGEKFLITTIDSCLNQTYADKEILLVNDGSTDQTEDICKDYQNKYPDIIRYISKENGGTASALNLGIKKMSGDWFKWLSADDYFSSEDSMEKMVNEIKNTPESHDIIFYSKFYLVDKDNNIIKESNDPNYNKLTLEEQQVRILDSFFANGSTTYIHKTVFDRVGLFDEKVSLNEDYQLWLRMSVIHKFRFHILPEFLINYRVHSGTLSSNKLIEAIIVENQIRLSILNMLPKSEADNLRKKLKKYDRRNLKSWLKRKMRDSLVNYTPSFVAGFFIKHYKIKRGTVV